MIENLKIILCITIAFIISGIWFGCNLGCNVFLKKFADKWVIHLCPILASLPILIIEAFTIGFLPIQIDLHISIKLFGIVILTAIICAIIISNKKQREFKSGTKLLWWGIDGVIMEIPQRLMMQSLIYGIFRFLKISEIDFWTVICTASVWCMAIFAQNIILKQPFDKELLIEMVASFVFSIGVGYVYQKAGIIIITMIGHFCERLISNALLQKMKMGRKAFK